MPSVVYCVLLMCHCHVIGGRQDLKNEGLLGAGGPVATTLF